MKTIPNRSFYSYNANTVLWLVMVGKRVDGCFKTKISAGKMVSYLLTIGVEAKLVKALADSEGDFIIDSSEMMG